MNATCHYVKCKFCFTSEITVTLVLEAECAVSSQSFLGQLNPFHIILIFSVKIVLVLLSYICLGLQVVII
jgi:hypothetical protein